MHMPYTVYKYINAIYKQLLQEIQLVYTHMKNLVIN